MSTLTALLLTGMLHAFAATGDPTRLSGQTSTLLPTGQRLLVGGLQQGAPTNTATLVDPSTGVLQPLTARLTIARSAHTTTVLPDGRVLVFGGIDKTGAVVTQAEVYDINSQRFDILANGPTPRRGHTAAMLLDGSLLIVGGRTQQGTSTADDLSTTAELWHPKTGVTTVLTSPASSSAIGAASLARDGATPRILADGRVLYTGGRDAAGIALTNAVAYTPGQGFSAMAAAEAQLLIAAAATTPPQLMASLPEPEVSDFSSDAVIAVRFSTPMDVTTVTRLSVVLFGPTGEVDVHVVPAEAGQLIFVTPRLALLPGARYTLFLYAVRAANGQALPFQALSFNTASLKAGDTGQGGATSPAPSASTSAAAPKPGSPTTSAARVLDHDLRLRDRLRQLRARGGVPRTQALAPNLADITGAGNKVLDVDDDDDEVFVPNASHQGGHWRTGKTTPEFVHALLDNDHRVRDRLTKLRARGGAARRAQAIGQRAVAAQASPTPNTPGIGGTVLRLNDQPLANVTVSLGTYSTLTDTQGRFHITGVPPGHYELNVDGASASNNGRDYAQFVFGVDIQADRFTELTHALYLPRVRAKDWTNINAPTTTDTVVTHPDIPDLEIRIPQGTVIRDRQGKALTRIAIVPVPLDRAPFPTPANFPVYFMIHPGGAVIQGPAPRGSVNTPGVRIIYPNYTHDAPGTAHNFWMYDARERGWFVYGQAHVAANGKQIIPDPGVALNEHMAGGHSVGGPAGPSPAPPPRDGGQGPNDPPQEGDPVDVATGLFVRDLTDVRLSDALPLALTRTYRPGDTIVRPFGIGTTHNFAMYLRNLGVLPNTTQQTYQLVLPDGAVINFPYLSGTGLHTDMTWEHATSPSRFYRARLSAPYDVLRGEYYIIVLTDGTRYEFAIATGALLRMIDRNGNITEVTQNSGLIQRIATTTGRYLDFTYDTSNRISQITDITGRAWTYAYTTAGYLSKATYPDLSFEEYTYDTAGRMLTVKGKRGNIVVTNVYDANGRVSQQTAADGGIYRFTYITDANGKVTQTDITDPRNVVRRYSFHATGYPLSTTDALGTLSARTTTYVRSATSGHATATIDPLGRRTDYVYDAKGNVTRTTRLAGTPQAVTQSYTYEPRYNQVSTYTDPLNKTVRYTYDIKGNLTQITDPLLNATRITYNAAGQPLTMRDPLGNTTTLTYDLNDLVQIRDPLGRVTQRYIDLLGRLNTDTDPLGRRTTYEYDPIDRLTRMTDALGQLTQYTYDANSNLSSVTDPRTGKTQYTYDARNRLSLRIDPLLKSESFLYDGNDNVIRYTDRKGQITNYIYDPLNRRTNASYADATSTITTFDAGDRPIQVSDTNGTISRAYDGLDRLTIEATPQGRVTYTYDVNSRRTSLTVTGQPVITYLYDNADRLTQITQGTTSVRLAYDAASRRTTLTLPNGIIATYGYDSASQLTALTYRLGATVVGNLAYAYDALGQRTNITGSLARTSLPSAATASNDVANRVTNWNGTTITYDLNGNILNDGTRTYTWDARNRLTQITGPINASFQYDPYGRRTRKTIATTTSYLYDGSNPVQELNGTTSIANLITGLNIDEYFRRTDSLGPRDFLTDALGSTLALADSTGIIQTSYTYAPYGNTITTGQANSNPFQYTGRENDGTGLYYYRARYYDAVRQRFITSDPIGLAGGLNTYLYAEANPLLYTDPLGLFSASDLPNIPQPIVDTVTGFGDAFLISELVRDALDIDGGVNKCTAAYRGGKIGGSITGGVPFALRGAAAAGATRAGHWLNHGQYWRIGPGRMPSAGPGLPGGGQVPRMTIGRDVAGSNRPHADLRSRIPYAPPIGGPTTSDDCSSR